MSRPPPAVDPARLEAGGAPVTRRTALKLLSSQMALLAAGCGRPPSEIVPYVTMPERLVPGVPLQFASTLPLGGLGRGVVCTSVEGRPIKVSGNPRHPMSLGATDVFAEAAVYCLYDPDRSQAVRHKGEIAAWVELQTAIVARSADWAASGGRGLRILTGPLSSPTALSQIAALLARHPQARWHVHDPLRDQAARLGAQAAFGRSVSILPRWESVRVLVTFDADPLGAGPAQIRNASGFASARRVRQATRDMLRVYAIEATPTLVGAKADHRVVAPIERIEACVVALARRLGADLPDPGLDAVLQARVEAIGRDLESHPGGGLAQAGPTLGPEIHALVHWINGALGAPVDALAPVLSDDAPTLDDLAADLARGTVDTLLIAGCNPLYDSPDPQRLRDAIGRVPLSIHLGLLVDETAQACGWHVPDSHPLESWSDLRGLDGTASFVQPLIRPLYDTRSLHGLLAALAGDFDADDYALVRAAWRERAPAGDFEAWWRRCLHDGVVPGSAGDLLTLPKPSLPSIPPPAPKPSGFVVSLGPDPTVWDGSFANNAWLQECPKPFAKDVWGNALGIGEVDAHALGLADGDHVRLSAGERSIVAPVRVSGGHAPGCLSLSLGYGRTAGGTIGPGLGVDAFALASEVGQRAIAVTVEKTGTRGRLYATQEQFRLEGEAPDLYPILSLDRFPADAAAAPRGPLPTLLPDHAYPAARWAMVIDTGACIGCNACVVACQVENNVPVIGPDEIARNRDMHWLRIDRYDVPDASGSRTGFQPVPCMQCETAPCEPVCPVSASVHDSEGLNVQVYNRCIGTRFCEANCPYKVRRFNFFGYADDQPLKSLGEEVMRAHNNPNVTVRARGVMEKCTYCVQRISAARREAEKEARSLGDDDVVTACQSACPTRAIAFGNLNAPGSAVARLRQEPHHYALLEQLDTKPRTTYLADVRNPSPDFGGRG